MDKTCKFYKLYCSKSCF